MGKAHLLLSTGLLCLYGIWCCDEGLPCTSPDGKLGLCFGNKCIIHINPEVRQNLAFDIVIRYPSISLKNFGGTDLFIRGSGLGLKWTRGVRLSQLFPDIWTFRMLYKSSIKGIQCQNCSDQSYLAGNTLEYRIFVDDIKDMLGANFVIRFPISASSPFFDDKPAFVDFPWFSTKTGNVTSYQIDSSYIGRTLDLALYTPPSFLENTFKTYPVAMIFDLQPRNTQAFQYVFEEPIYPAAVAQEFIVIGFGDFGGPSGRSDLLTPTSGVDLECINGTFDNKCDGCVPDNINITEYLWYMKHVCGKPVINQGLGEKTLDFLIKEALPKALELTSHRANRDKLGIMGYSLGGLMACHAAWTRPEVFSFAACQSPSFWWPMNNETLVTCDFDFLNKTLKDPSLKQNRPEQRIYIDAGDLESDAPFRLAQSAVEAAYAISQMEHYELNSNVWIEIAPGMEHSGLSWGKRLYNALMSVLPVPGGSERPSSSDLPIVG